MSGPAGLFFYPISNTYILHWSSLDKSWAEWDEFFGAQVTCPLEVLHTLHPKKIV